MFFNKNYLTLKATITYTYGASAWKDKLTSYNGSAISYDVIGNPTGDGTWTYTWEKGRQLKKMSKTGTTAEFKYNADGLRVQKKVTVSGTATTTNYILHGKNIVHMTRGSTALHFWYDAQNRPAIVLYGSTRYAYVHNLQGDIVGIIDSAGTEVVKYTYDAWGKVLSTTGSLASTLGTVQPFRYRGYVYDVETGLYYLRSRYYNPVWGRFIIADSLIRGNLFAYCNNNPIIQKDESGRSAVPYEVVPYLIQGAASGISVSAGSIFAPLIAAFFLLFPAHTASDEEGDSFVYEQVVEEAEEVEEASTSNKSAVYVGAMIKDHKFVELTPPMDIVAAVGWAYGLSNLPIKSGGMGIHSKWGIYTQSIEDAYAIYLPLLPVGSVLPEPAPIMHVGLTGQYPHLHLPNYLFNNKNKHFHIWYGEIGGK